MDTSMRTMRTGCQITLMKVTMSQTLMVFWTTRMTTSITITISILSKTPMMKRCTTFRIQHLLIMTG